MASREPKLTTPRRTAFLESQGYRVIRFWNSELHENLEGVLDTIYAALYGGLHAAPARFERRRIHEISLSLRENPPAASEADLPTPALGVDPPPQGEGEPP
jgi:hypothetical protein